jgi:hypothetical protein
MVFRLAVYKFLINENLISFSFTDIQLRHDDWRWAKRQDAESEISLLFFAK